MEGAQAEVDVVLPTKNSMKPSLEKCVSSIFRAVPVHHLLVVDGGSKDGTVEYFAGMRRAVVIDDSAGSRATARQKGIEAVDTDLFVFVDSDVELEEGWFSKAVPKLTGTTGGVCGFQMPMEKHSLNIFRAMAKLYRTGSVQGLSRYGRFNSSNALIRTSAAKGISIPKEFETGEDELIMNFIRRRGFATACLPSPVAFHYREDEDPRRSAVAGYLFRRHGTRSAKYLVKRLFFNSIIEFLWIVVYTQDLAAAKTRLRRDAYTLAGYLSAPKPAQRRPEA